MSEKQFPVRLPYLNVARPMDSWDVQMGNVRVHDYGKHSPHFAGEYDVSAALHLDRSTILMINSPAQARQLAAAARRLAVAMERAEETGEDQRGDSEQNHG